MIVKQDSQVSDYAHNFNPNLKRLETKIERGGSNHSMFDSEKIESMSKSEVTSNKEENKDQQEDLDNIDIKDWVYQNIKLFKKDTKRSKWVGNLSNNG